jgi:hypothetical protein
MSRPNSKYIKKEIKKEINCHGNNKMGEIINESNYC